jgi:hypothetical protein
MKLSHSYSRLKLYENCPLRYYRQCIVKDVTDSGGEASKHGERIHKYLEERLASNASLPQEAAVYEVLCKSVEAMAEGGELLIEKELVLTDQLTPTGWWEPDAWLRSKLDILVIRGDTAYVMDWKTGKRNPDNFQMLLFAAQVFKHYPQVQKIKTVLVWLKTMQMDTEDYNRVNMNGAWAEVMKRIRRIHDSADSGVWPARPSGLCRFCPARHDCKFAAL